MGRTTVYNNITSEENISKINKKNVDLMNDFLDYLVSTDRSSGTINGYKNDLLIFFCWNLDNNDNKYFVDLSKREIAKFQKYAITEWGWSTNRLSRVKSAMSSMSNYIENILDDELPDFRPIVRKIESPVKQVRREKTIITDEEVQNILDTLVSRKKYQIACIFALAAFGGARKSELLRYKISYFDDSNIMADAALYKTPEKIKTKGRGSQGKLLYKYTLIDFKKYYDLWMTYRKENDLMNSEFLFINQTNGSPLTVAGIDGYTKMISDILGRPFYTHSLRHQLCSRLFRLGLPSDIIQEYFGWSSADMLNIYNDNEASDSFGKYFTSDGIKGSNKSLNDL